MTYWLLAANIVVIAGLWATGGKQRFGFLCLGAGAVSWFAWAAYQAHWELGSICLVLAAAAFRRWWLEDGEPHRELVNAYPVLYDPDGQIRWRRRPVRNLRQDGIEPLSR